MAAIASAPATIPPMLATFAAAPLGLLEVGAALLCEAGVEDAGAVVVEPTGAVVVVRPEVTVLTADDELDATEDPDERRHEVSELDCTTLLSQSQASTTFAKTRDDAKLTGELRS